MSQKYQISLPAAIFININIMMGSGIFINMVPLAKLSGILGSLVYFVFAIVMLPIVLAIVELLRLYPGGSFYTFGAQSVNKFFGFLTAWCYFIGKLASGSLMIHFASSIIKSLIPALKSIDALVLDIIILSFFTLLNTLNLKAGSRIQFVFVILKMIPITFIVLSGLFLFSTQNITAQSFIWSGFLPSVPLVVFALAGFESACSISRHIKNPDKNAPKAVLISFMIVMCIYFSYQLLYYLMLGSKINQVQEYFEAFPFLLKNIFSFNDDLINKLKALFQLAIASSALGGAYGILFSNSWNLYMLAENGHTFFPKFIQRTNKFNIPVVCVLIETLVCIGYFFLTKGNNIVLQQISSFGLTATYLLCCIALWFSVYKNNDLKSKIISIVSILSCLTILSIFISRFLVTGMLQFLIFLTIIFLGMIMYHVTKKINF